MYKRPFVLASFAQTLDGALSTADSKPLAISSPLSQILTHALRGRLDAILVGIGTVLADNPALSCRVEELSAKWAAAAGGGASALTGAQAGHLAGGSPYRQPRRIVLDPRLDIPEQARILEGLNEAALAIFYDPVLAGKAYAGKAERLAARGVLLRPTAGRRAGWEEILAYLRESKLASVFIEGGRRVISSALEGGYADALIITQAPFIQGGSAGWYPNEAPRGFSLASVLRAGDDLIAEYLPGKQPGPERGQGRILAAEARRPPYRSLALLAAELGIPGLEALVPQAQATRRFFRR